MIRYQRQGPIGSCFFIGDPIYRIGMVQGETSDYCYESIVRLPPENLKGGEGLRCPLEWLAAMS